MFCFLSLFIPYIVATLTQDWLPHTPRYLSQSPQQIPTTLSNLCRIPCLILTCQFPPSAQAIHLPLQQRECVSGGSGIFLVAYLQADEHSASLHERDISHSLVLINSEIPRECEQYRRHPFHSVSL